MTHPSRFRNNGGQPFDTLAEWERVAGPKHQHQWAEGRSAAELARAWAEGGAEQAVVRLLGRLPAFADLRIESRTAEKQTYFDDVPGSPRHHDLLLEGRAAAGLVVIGVEAKADEPFDDTLLVRTRKARSRSAGSRLPERVDFLTGALVGRRLADDPTLGELRYQLFTALAGTVVAAFSADPAHAASAAAVLLVHEFRTSRTSAAALERNAGDLQRFVAVVAPDALRTRDGDNWIVGPFDVMNEHPRWPKRQSTYVAKLMTLVPPGPTS